MARPLRIQYPDAYYHVMNRGNRRDDIFITDQDRQVFLDALADSCETYQVKLISYVLMTNHFLCGASHNTSTCWFRHLELISASLCGIFWSPTQ
jgi:REP element-mobilizing transposase RayT